MPIQPPEDCPHPSFLLALIVMQRLASLQIQEAVQIRKVEAEARVAEARAREKSALLVGALLLLELLSTLR